MVVVLVVVAAAAAVIVPNISNQLFPQYKVFLCLIKECIAIMEPCLQNPTTGPYHGPLWFTP
jgi:hypothetical protein